MAFGAALAQRFCAAAAAMAVLVVVRHDSDDAGGTAKVIIGVVCCQTSGDEKRNALGVDHGCLAATEVCHQISPNSPAARVALIPVSPQDRFTYLALQSLGQASGNELAPI